MNLTLPNDGTVAVARGVRHEIRDQTRALWAVHCRRYDADGSKDMWWEGPHGERGLGGARAASLPLYGAHFIRGWDRAKPVVVPEGEPAADVLLALGYQALGTVTGADGCPSYESLSILAGWEVILWPDADAAGVLHMERIAARLAPQAVRWVSWSDPPYIGADATDADPTAIRALLADAQPMDTSRLEGIQDTAGERSSSDHNGGSLAATSSPYVLAIRQFNADHGVCEVLAVDWDVESAEPGRTIRCPAHDDRSPSLSISGDDRRVWCHSPSCVLHGEDGQGHDAFSLAVQARQLEMA